MRFDFNENELTFLKIIVKNAQMLGKRVFFVGGIVRDNIFKIPTTDIDLLLMGNAIEFSKNLPKEIVVNSIHKDFYTIKVQYKDLQIDIASSRTETYPYSGCLPVLDEVGVSIKKDVLRRDFKINALYCELKLINNELKFELIDLVDGLNDIKNKVLSVLHSKSYIDDPTRIIRGVGFKYRFGFDFSAYDKKLINEYLLKIDYLNMSLDRNLKVIKNVLNNDFQDDIFKEIVEKKYYKIINPVDVDVDFSLIKNVFSIFNLSKNEKAEFYLNILKNEAIEQIKSSDIVDVYKKFKNFSKLNLAYYYYFTQDKNVLTFNQIKDIKLFINGHDLIDLGFKQGSEIGKMLDFVLREKLLNPSKIISKEDELKLVSTKIKNLT